LLDAQCIGDCHGVVGTVFESEPLLRSQTGAVTPVVERHDAIVLAEPRVAPEPVEIGGSRPAMEEQDRGGGISRTEVAYDDRATIGKVDEPTWR